MESARSSLEGLCMEYPGVGPVFLHGPLLTVVAQLIPSNTFKERHNSGYLLQYYVSGISLLRVPHPVHHIHHNLPVRLCPFKRLHNLLNLLYPSLTVGESALLFKE